MGTKYEFEVDWFDRHIPLWENLFAPLQDAPACRYLEIGLHEGRSAVWMLENVLTAGDARLVGIDPFVFGNRCRFFSNLDRSGCASKAEIHVAESREVLPRLSKSSFDAIYVDGSHTAEDVLADAVQSWPLLKPGGLMVFDDYPMSHHNVPPELLPKLAIDAFVAAYRHSLQVEHWNYQVVVRKSAREGRAKWCSTLVGRRHSYDWTSKRIVLIENNHPFPLTSEEQTLVERIAHSTRLGVEGYELPADLQDSREYRELKTRLGLEGAGL